MLAGSVALSAYIGGVSEQRPAHDVAYQIAYDNSDSASLGSLTFSLALFVFGMPLTNAISIAVPTFLVANFAWSFYDAYKNYQNPQQNPETASDVVSGVTVLDPDIVGENNQPFEF